MKIITVYPKNKWLRNKRQLLINKIDNSADNTIEKKILLRESFDYKILPIVPVDFYDYCPAKLFFLDLTSQLTDRIKLCFTDNSIASLSCMDTLTRIKNQDWACGCSVLRILKTNIN